MLDQLYTYENEHNLGELKLLRYMPEFVRFSRFSDPYVEDCVRYLSEPEHTQQQRMIAGLSMRKLTLPHFF